MKLPRSINRFFFVVPFVLLLTTCSMPGDSLTPPVATTDSAVATPTINISIVIPPVNTDAAETVFVPGDTYLLGSNSSVPAALPHEIPEHEVTLSGFNIYTHEVTNAMYRACVEAGACLGVSTLRSDLADYYNSSMYDQYPVVGVDWHMANSYCQWANGRLPTEAEWEAAARGAEARSYPWGEDPASCQNAGMLGCAAESLPFQVGSFANGNSPFEAWDMAGNVWEWVNDWYDANYYANSSGGNPLGPWGGDYKVLRGGGWNSTADAVRSANRAATDPTRSYLDVGFRCVANGFASEESISLPEESHTVSDGGSRSFDDPGRPGSGPGSDSGTDPGAVRVWRWGIPSSACTAGPNGLLTLWASNSFGGTYSATIDGTPVTCTYNDTVHALTCRWPLAGPLSGPGGAEYYEAAIRLTDPAGTAIEGAGYTFRIDPARFAGCSATSDAGLNASASAYCGVDNLPIFSVHTSMPMLITGLSGDVAVGDVASLCTSVSATGVVCPLDASFMGSSITGSVVGTSLDGVTPLSAAYPAISVPTCSASGSSAPYSLIPLSECTGGGLPGVGVAWLPVDSLTIERVMDDSVSRALVCTSTPGAVNCQAPMRGTDGNYHVTAFFRQAGTPTSEFWFTFSAMVRACPGEIPVTSNLHFNPPTCRTDGMMGLETTIDYFGTATGANVNIRTGGTMWACIPGSTPHSFTCFLPVPVPSDLEVCYSDDSHPVSCTPNPYIGLHLPERCGGSPASDSWNLGLTCGTGGSAYQATVSLTGGRIPTSLVAVLSGFSLPCSANPSLPGSFSCPLPIGVLLSNPEFVARFSDGSEERHTFSNFNSLLPTECPSGGGSTTPTAGACELPSSSSWSNPANRFDVNNDGCITPPDVLALITAINAAGGPYSLPASRPAGSGFLDVNGDGSLTSMDVLLVINYLNAHVGESCTPACGPGAPGASSSWTYEVACNSTTGETTITAHFPEPWSDVDMGGGGQSGCVTLFYGADGYFSMTCPAGTSFSSPLPFWVHHTDGAISRMEIPGTELAAAVLACASGATPAPVFNAEATCSSPPGSYDVHFSWTPAEYEVYAIYDQLGRVLTSCGICSAGSCDCTGLLPETDGLIHVLMDNRTGATEVTTPLAIAPPTCGGSGSGDWGMTAECNPTRGPNVVQVRFHFPPGITPVILTDISIHPGMLICQVYATEVVCDFNLSTTLRAPLTMAFTGPAPENALIYYNYTAFGSILPTSCSSPGGGSGSVVLNHSCVGGRGQLRVDAMPGTNITSLTLNGISPAPSECIGMGSSTVICLVPESLMGTRVTVQTNGRDATMTDMSWTMEYTPVCLDEGAEGWSLHSATCTSLGGQAVATFHYPAGLTIDSAEATDGILAFRCMNYPDGTPPRLICVGRTTSAPGPLQLTYSSGGVSTTRIFADWMTIAPRFCPTPVPPTPTTPAHEASCPDYTDQATCEAALGGVCKWNPGENRCYHP